jgi:SPP1 gp7 family putative phage head morphogenesis protein
MLRKYADALAPWAERVGGRMVREVERRDRDAWRRMGNAMSREMHAILQRADVAGQVRSLHREQVDLITSIPRKAAERVALLTTEGLESGTRAREVAALIANSTDVTKSRAVLIARTETSRAATEVLRARCLGAGVEAYVWRTAGDGDVRPGHAEMEGRVCRWDDPPAVREGQRVMHFHAGCVWNCRCWAEPIVPGGDADRRQGKGRPN